MQTAFEVIKKQYEQESQTEPIKQRGHKLYQTSQEHEKYSSKMRANEWKKCLRLNIKQSAYRQKLFFWIFEQGATMLQLKHKTMELAMRLFDLFLYNSQNKPREKGPFKFKLVSTKGQKTKNILDNTDQSRLLLITCLLICAKYVQIYPPCINDFLYLVDDKFERATLLKRQVQILQLTDFGLAENTVSGWYEHLYLKRMPIWGFKCYIKMLKFNTEAIARGIRYIYLHHTSHTIHPFQAEGKPESQVFKLVNLSNLSILSNQKSVKSSPSLMTQYQSDKKK